MDVLHVILQILLGITSLLLTLLILLHKGRGGGLSDMFGGGMSSGLSSSGVAERNLNRFTIILGVTWGVVIIALGLLMRFTGVADSERQSASTISPARSGSFPDWAGLFPAARGNCGLNCGYRI